MARNAKASVKRQRKLKSIRKQQKANELRNQVQDALKWLIDERIFVGISCMAIPLGNVCSLVCLAMLWVWSTTPQLTEAFVDARSKAEKLLIPITITTYQGLMKALVSATPKLMPALQRQMHDFNEQSWTQTHAYWALDCDCC